MKKYCIEFMLNGEKRWTNICAINENEALVQLSYNVKGIEKIVRITDTAVWKK